MSYLLYSLFSLLVVSSAFAQTNLSCNAASVPPLVRVEGITERTGDIVLSCSGGGQAATVSGNLTLFSSVNITNRLSSNSSNIVTGLAFTVDNGSGPRPLNMQGILTGPGTLVFNGVSFTLSSTGSAVVRLAGLRVAANQSAGAPNGAITVLLSFTSGISGSNLFLTNNQFPVGNSERGLYASFSSKIICAPQGSPLPANLGSLASFLASNAVFNSTRVTEGFAGAFSPRTAIQGLNADSGTRFLVQYSGFPQGAQLFVPNAIAGSDAVQATAGGDFGVPASGGQYAPGGNGSLLLSLVQGTDSNGAGGAPIFTPGAPGSGTVTLDGMTQLPLSNGSAFAVYEVMDSNPFLIESAQFPTFLGLAANGVSAQTSENISFAPISTVVTATATDPIPRFQQQTPSSDCTIVGDCGASYFPSLSVLESSLQYTAVAGSNFQAGYIEVQNASGGVLNWTTSITYQNGSGWLSVSPASGVNNGTIRVDATPGSLAAGTYQATLTIDAGPGAGARTIPITLTITPAPGAIAGPVVSSVVNAATFSAGPVAPGSIATIMGSAFTGSNLTVAFDGTPAQILFSNDKQINLLVPAMLGSKTTAQFTVAANGAASTPQNIALAPFAPGIFQNGILNQDYTVNGPAHPAALGTVIQIFATGLSGNGTITAKIGGEIVNQPYYAGAAPGLLGVQQVDLIVPSDISAGSAAVSVCGGVAADSMVCSPAVQVSVTLP
jgi:uncharacterized protein (TIGR03437 family)